MDEGFTKALKLFIDCYERNPEVTEIHLWSASDEINYVNREDSYKGESKARRESQKRTMKAIRKRLLGRPDEVLGEYAKIGKSAPPEPVDTQAVEPIWDDWRIEGQYERFMNIVASAIGRTREELEQIFSEHGYTRDEQFSLMDDPSWKDAEARYLFTSDSQPNLHLYLAKEFASSLDTWVVKIEEIAEVRYRDSIPDHLKNFMREAYRCDLYGLDAACAVVCGAVLEEAIRIRLHRRGFTGLSEAIQAAEHAALLIPRAIESAEEINRIRIDAAHGKPAFSNSQEYRRKSVLAGTREILDTLFALDE